MTTACTKAQVTAALTEHEQPTGWQQIKDVSFQDADNATGTVILIYGSERQEEEWLFVREGTSWRIDWVAGLENCEDVGMRRAVVIGLGCVTPIGQSVEEFWSALTSGQSGVRRITQFDPSELDCQIAAEVKDWDPTNWMEAKSARRAARFSQFAVAAARQAVEDAELPITDDNRDDIAIAMNTGGGGVDVIADSERTLLEKGANRVGPFTVPAYAPNMASCQVAINLGVRGPTTTSVAACAAGVFAFVEAKRLIDLGEADVVIAGGAEANIVPVSLAAMGNMRALSTRNDEPEKACRRSTRSVTDSSTERAQRRSLSRLPIMPRRAARASTPSSPEARSRRTPSTSRRRTLRGSPPAGRSRRRWSAPGSPQRRLT